VVKESEVGAREVFLRRNDTHASSNKMLGWRGREAPNEDTWLGKLGMELGLNLCLHGWFMVGLIDDRCDGNCTFNTVLALGFVG